MSLIYDGCIRLRPGSPGSHLFSARGLLYLIYGNTLVSRLWQRLGPGIMVFCFLGVLAGKLGGMGYSDLLTKVVLPLVGLVL